MIVLTTKELAEAWSMGVTHTSQAWDPWYKKLVLLCQHHPTEAVKILARAFEDANPGTCREPFLRSATGL